MRGVLTFFLMLAFWLILSGKVDPWHLGWGIACSLVVSALGHDLLFRGPLSLREKAWEALRFLAYIPWLLKEIALAALNVAILAWHPRMEELIDPRVIRFRTRLKKDLSKVTFANSITLTPGTITLEVDGDLFYVHSLDPKSRAGLPGEMEERCGRVFGEGLP